MELVVAHKERKGEDASTPDALFARALFRLIGNFAPFFTTFSYIPPL